MPNVAAATTIPIPSAISRTFQLARCAGIECIGFPFLIRCGCACIWIQRRSSEVVANSFIAEENGRLMRSLRNAIVIGFAIGLGVGQARAGEFDSILRWRN